MNSAFLLIANIILHHLLSPFVLIRFTVVASGKVSVNLQGLPSIKIITDKESKEQKLNNNS